MTPELQHDILVAAIWPVVTAVLNLAVVLLGKSEHPAAKLLAAVGTSLLQKKSKTE